MAHDDADLHLPVTTITVVDIGRLQRELEALNNFLAQAAARASGESVAMPKTTKTFEDFAKQNALQLHQEADREKLGKFLEYIRESAPVIHMSFAAEPSAKAMQKIITWLRTEIDPNVLLQVGLQPSIAAGCVLRTTNKYFDFSMRKHFYDQRELLVQSMRQGAGSGS
jgi:F0F1-type ATP synthase delta subunit